MRSRECAYQIARALLGKAVDQAARPEAHQIFVLDAIFASEGDAEAQQVHQRIFFAPLQAGANFVLYKPLVREQMERSLRAGQAFMRPDRRKSRRQKAESLVYLRFGDVCPVPALVLEISEDGLSVQASEPLPAAELPLRFILPGTTYMLEGSGEVTWADDMGRGGIFFSKMSPAARRQLKAWLAKQDKKKPSRVRAAARAAKKRAVDIPAN